MTDDATLLRRYFEERSEASFAELVRRHLNLVYAAALRQTGDSHLAEEVAQRVFTRLAQKAGQLLDHPALAGWLYRSTRYAAADARRARQRWRGRFVEAQAMSDFPAEDPCHAEWEQLRPMLDDAMCELREGDRDAVLWRYFEGRSYAEIGARLHIQENTARMRVERALDKLRGVLARRGFSSSAAALGGALATQAVTAAPAGLAAQIVGAAATVPAAAGLAAIFATMTKTQTALVGALVAAGITVGAGAFIVRPLRQENASLRQQNAQMQQALRDNPKAAAAVTANSLAVLAGRVQQRKANEGRKATPAPGEAPRTDVYRDMGNKTPDAALETFTGACFNSDSESIGKLIYFDGEGRKIAERVLASLPEAVRAQYPTPEALYGFFTAADCLVAPPPADPAVIKKAELSYLSAERVAFRRPGQTSGGQEFQLTQDGWKRVYPERAIEALADQVLHTNPF